MMNHAEEIAKLFHETYERLAPQFGYKTRDASAVPWADVPENNRALMIATVAALPLMGVQQTIDALQLAKDIHRHWYQNHNMPCLSNDACVEASQIIEAALPAQSGSGVMRREDMARDIAARLRMWAEVGNWPAEHNNKTDAVRFAMREAADALSALPHTGQPQEGSEGREETDNAIRDRALELAAQIVINSKADPAIAFAIRNLKSDQDGISSRAISRQAPCTGEGWKLVPVDPTEEMIRAGATTPQMKTVDSAITIAAVHGCKLTPSTPLTSPLAEAYRAMLSTAPASPRAEGE